MFPQAPRELSALIVPVAQEDAQRRGLHAHSISAFARARRRPVAAARPTAMPLFKATFAQSSTSTTPPFDKSDRIDEDAIVAAGRSSAGAAAQVAAQPCRSRTTARLLTPGSTHRDARRLGIDALYRVTPATVPMLDTLPLVSVTGKHIQANSTDAERGQSMSRGIEWGL